MIYIIEGKDGENSVFKIGTTSGSPWKRLGQLRRQNAVKLNLVGALIGDKSDEQNFHHAFRKWRLHGEWFSDCPGIRLLIKDFPIEQWQDTEDLLASGLINFQEAYIKLTLLKFEKPFLPIQNP